MRRGLIGRRGLLCVLAGILASAASAERLAPGDESAPIVTRFLAQADPVLTQCRSLRHLEAHNNKFDMHGWMDVWTEADAYGFRYQIVDEGGSDYIRTRVFRETLETERRLTAPGAAAKAALTPANYVFEERAAGDEGLAQLAIRPRRRDVLLLNGAIFLRPDDAELVRMEGEMAKPPSFWTRQVWIVRRFDRLGGVRLPISVEATADVRFAGRSTFRMEYEYESVNAQRVGSPQLRARSR
jgi:hypothetical protein